MIRGSRFSLSGMMLLLCAAMLVRALVPAGWMPMPDADGIVRLVPCDGYAPPAQPAKAQSTSDHHAHMAHASHGEDRGGEDHTNHDGHVPRDPCPFGLALAHGLDLPGEPPALAAEPMAPALDFPALVAARLIALKSLRPPARGPPSFA